MKLAFHQITSGAGHDLAETFKAYADAGWGHFEINFGECQSYIDEHGIDALVKLAGDHGLKCVGATGISFPAFSGDEKLAETLTQLKTYAEYMEALGCEAIVCGGETPPDFNPRAQGSTEKALFARDAEYLAKLEVFAAAIAKAADLVAPNGVKLALEVNWCGLARSIRTMAALVNMVDRGNVGAVWDPAHFFSTPSRLDDLDRLNGKIFHAHMNDIRECVIEVMDINGDRVIPGEGSLPLREWSDKVEACGYDGWHCVELFSDDIWAMPVSEIAKVVKAGCDKVWPDAQY